MDSLLYALLTIILILLGKEALNKAKLKKLKKDIWKKDYKNATDIDNTSLYELIRKANERRRDRINNRNKKR